MENKPTVKACWDVRGSLSDSVPHKYLYLSQKNSKTQQGPRAWLASLEGRHRLKPARHSRKLPSCWRSQGPGVSRMPPPKGVGPLYKTAHIPSAQNQANNFPAWSLDFKGKGMWGTPTSSAHPHICCLLFFSKLCLGLGRGPRPLL